MRCLARILPVLATLAGIAVPATADEILFHPAAAETGLDFVHENGATGELYMVEVTGAGGALFDYDGDGDLDVYLVQGGPLGPDAASRVDRPTDRIFRNDLGPDGTVRFVDVTESAGLDAREYGMGVAAGDVDGDALPDLYLANLGRNQLWRNRGDGTFAETTREAGVGDTRWTVASLFFDYDEDRDLDLWVGNYVDFTYARHRKCNTVGGAPDYCGPLAFSPLPDRLFRNRGDGTFEDVSSTSGLASQPGNALSGLAADLDQDGRVDLYVANDMMANFLWSNRGDGTFREDGLLAGVALNREGKPEASMGIAYGDPDFDLDDDILLTHLNGETNTFYRNLGGGSYRDDTIAVGIGPPSIDRTGFGTGFLDADGDGDLDLVVLNGAVRTLEEQAREGEPFPLKQADQLFLRQGDEWIDATARTVPDFLEPRVSRGLALGDVDLDGAIDLLINDNGAPARILFGRPPPGPALELRLEPPGEPPPLGAVVTATRGDGAPPLRRRVQVDGSYASASSPWITTTPGEARSFTGITVRRPDGTVQRWKGLPGKSLVSLVLSPPRDR